VPLADFQQASRTLCAADANDPRSLALAKDTVADLRDAMLRAGSPDLAGCLDAAAIILEVVLAGDRHDVEGCLATVRRMLSYCEVNVAGSGVAAPQPPPLQPQPAEPPLQFSNAELDAAAARLSEQPVQSQPSGPSTVLGQALIGEILIKLGLVTHEGIEQALEHQRQYGGRIGDVLLRTGAVSEAEMESAAQLQRLIHRQVAEEALAETAPGPAAPQPEMVGGAKLGQILQGRGLITREQLIAGLRIVQTTGCRIGEALVQTGAATWEQIDAAVAAQLAAEQTPGD
jgi:hypothetical protein